MSNLILHKIQTYVYSEKYTLLLISLCILDLFYGYTKLIHKTVVEKVMTYDKAVVPKSPYDSKKHGDFNLSDTKLIDIDFHWLIKPNICDRNSTLLLIIVPSDPDNIYRRMTIRDSWGKTTDSVKVVFALGKTKKDMTVNLRDESEHYEDILQGDFLEDYYNISYKHMMGLKWAWTHCGARYVLKTEEDSFVNRLVLNQFLIRELSPWGTENLIACQVHRGASVVRDPHSRHFVPAEVYPYERYPMYCSGQFILYSRDVLPRLIKASEFVKYFFIDDVYVTGFLRSMIQVQIQDLGYQYLDNKQQQLMLKQNGLNQRQFLYTLMKGEGGDAIIKMWKISNPCEYH